MEYIYILRAYGKNNESAIKLGYTNNLQSRMLTYDCCNPFTELLHTFEVNNALAFESTFHSKYKATIKREWYSESLYKTMLYEIEKHINSNLLIHAKFKDVVEECQKKDSDYLLWAFKRYDFLHAAIKYLGYDKMEEYEYSIPRIKRALIPFTDKTQESQVQNMLESYNLSQGTFVSNEKLKIIFSEIYSQLGILRNPKAKDIEKYNKVKTHQKLINKEKVNGVIIL